MLAIPIEIQQLSTMGVETYLIMIRLVGCHCVIDAGVGNLLAENGACFANSNSLISTLCRSMNYLMGRGTTAAEKLPNNNLDLVTGHNWCAAYLKFSHMIP